MSDRLTDDEIKTLRYYKQACAIYPELRTKFFGVPLEESIDRLLDEVEERRRAERSVAAELAMGLDKEQWDGHLQPEPFDASGNPWCPTCKAWHERSPGTMLWIKCKDGGA